MRTRHTFSKTATAILAIASFLPVPSLRAQPRRTVKGHIHPLALPQADRGAVAADSRLGAVSLMLKRSPAQERDLEALLEGQQNPSSPLYHQWLKPEQFAERFG